MNSITFLTAAACAAPAAMLPVIAPAAIAPMTVRLDFVSRCPSCCAKPPAAAPRRRRPGQWRRVTTGACGQVPSRTLDTLMIFRKRTELALASFLAARRNAGRHGDPIGILTIPISQRPRGGGGSAAGGAALTRPGGRPGSHDTQACSCERLAQARPNAASPVSPIPRSPSVAGSGTGKSSSRTRTPMSGWLLKIPSTPRVRKMR